MATKTTTTTTTRARKPRALSEAQIQQQCADFLQMDGWRPLRTDPCSDKGRGKGFGEIGMADYLFIRPAVFSDDITVLRNGLLGFKGRFPEWHIQDSSQGQILWVEFKKPGTEPTEHQYKWHLRERLAGFLTVMASVDFHPTFDGFVKWYRNSGLLRRAGL